MMTRSIFSYLDSTPLKERIGLTLAYVANFCLKATLTLLKPVPIGVAVGPFKAHLYCSIASTNPGSNTSPVSLAYSAPARYSNHSISKFIAFVISLILSAISGPIPSPGIKTAFIKNPLPIL